MRSAHGKLTSKNEWKSSSVAAFPLIFLPIGDRNLILEAFSDLEQSTLEQEFACLSRGDMVGEMLFIDTGLPAITVRALRDSQVLAIPRWPLEAKLLHDPGFAARFYRVLSVLLTNKQQAIAQQLGYAWWHCGQSNQGF